MSIHHFGPFEFSRIYGVDKEHDTVYLTRLCIGRLRLHIFHRGDQDPDPHDHPWDFWTFPLVGYWEDVTHFIGIDDECGPIITIVRREYVKPFRLHYRPATYTHRVLGPNSFREWPIITFVWRSGIERKWGFLRKDCWVPWKQYLYHGGKTAPCADIEGGIIHD